MRMDEDAVGGFFEDLPVLAFVLAGVLSVAGTASWAHETLSSEDSPRELGLLASQVVYQVVLELCAVDPVPTIESVRCADFSRVLIQLPDHVGCVVSVRCVHPVSGPLSSESLGEGLPAVTGSAHTLLNALCDGGMVAILEVWALVWQS